MPQSGNLSAARGIAATLAIALAATACGGAAQPIATTTSTPQQSPASASQSPSKQYRISIALIAPVGVLQDNAAHFKKALAAKGFVEGKNVTYDEKNAQGDLGNVQLMAQQMVQSKPDLIYALGTPLVVALHQKTSSIPVLFGAMTDPVKSDVVQSADKPGGNITGTSDFLPADTYIDLLKEALPKATRIGLLGNPAEQNTAIQISALQKVAASKGVTVTVAPVGSTAEIVPAVQSLKGRVDAAIVLQDNTVVSALPTVAKAALDAGIPLASAGGSNGADDGALFGFGVDYGQLGDVAAGMAAKILNGGSPGAIPVAYAYKEGSLQIKVNTATATKLGVTLPGAFLKNATAVSK